MPDARVQAAIDHTPDPGRGRGPLRGPAGRGGDVEGLLASAARRVVASYRIPRLVAAPIEPRVVVVAYDARSDQLTVWASAQDPHRPLPPMATAFVQSPSPNNPLGAKGIGKGGAIGTPATIANAVADALGGDAPDPPFTVEKLWRAMPAASGD